MDGGDGLVVVARPVEVGHPHAAQALPGDPQALGAERDRFHGDCALLVMRPCAGDRVRAHPTGDRGDRPCQPVPGIRRDGFGPHEDGTAPVGRHDAVEFRPVLVGPAGGREDRPDGRRHVETELGAVVRPDQAHRARTATQSPPALNTSVARPVARSKSSLRAPPPKTAATPGDPSTGSAMTPALTTEACTVPSGRATVKTARWWSASASRVTSARSAMTRVSLSRCAGPSAPSFGPEPDLRLRFA